MAPRSIHMFVCVLLIVLAVALNPITADDDFKDGSPGETSSPSTTSATPPPASTATVGDSVTADTTSDPTAVSNTTNAEVSGSPPANVNSTQGDVCPDGQEPIVDATSCYILCPKGAMFYDSAGPKPDGECCTIKEYIEGTNFLKAEYPGACNGKGRCLRLNETMTATPPDTATTGSNPTTVSEALAETATASVTTPKP